ncbi:hypothetical protein GN956_G16801 [Arapaima gigas]
MSYPEGLRSVSSSCSESEEEQNLNDFQRKMKQEHQQALANINKACVIMERNRRKRITVSCNKLRELLPRVQGARSDMVTVLEMTIAFLEHVKVFVEEHQCREVLYPPEELHCFWFLETQLRKQESQRKVSEEAQRQTAHRCRRSQCVTKHFSSSVGRRPSGKSVANSSLQELSNLEKRATSPQQMDFPEVKDMNHPVSSALEGSPKISAPSFWSPVNLTSPLSSVSQDLQVVSWTCCATPVCEKHSL